MIPFIGHYCNDKIKEMKIRLLFPMRHGKRVVAIKDDTRDPCGDEIIQYFDCINFNILFDRE